MQHLRTAFSIVCGLPLLCLLPLAPSARADSFDTLRQKWQTTLLNNGGSPSSIANTANSYWSSMNTNAARTCLWNSLPLGSVSANLASTFDQLQAMALAWATPSCSLYGNAKLAAATADGLDWMNAHIYSTNATEYDNWYHWEIGAPQSLNDTVVLLYPALTGAQVTNYNQAVDRFSPNGPGAKYGWMTGANTTDKVLVVVLRAILGKDSAKLALAQTNLSPVFPYVTSGDGFYADGSFIQHSVIAYNGHYGLVLLGDIPKLVNLLQGSAWQITDPNLANVYSWVSNSFEPFIYNGAMMDMVRGRAISWSYETEFNDGSSTLSAVRQIAQFAPPGTALAFSNWANAPHLGSGQFHFPRMDRVVALRNGFGFGISMSSSRTANYESINGGNLHGWFTGDGMTYLYLGNNETQFNSDFWPTVDPYHLPGTTVETNTHANSAGEATTTSQSWVGGAQVAATYGAAGMSLAAWNTTLVGKKSWFMFDNEIVCLGAGITCSGPAEVHTTVEDRRLGASPTNRLTLKGAVVPPTAGWSSNLTGATWCALDGVGGYYFPGAPTNLLAAFVANTGSWVQINNVDSSQNYTDNYLKLWFNAGLTPTNAAYAYVLLPNMSAAGVSNYAANPDITILSNTATIQAVSKPILGVVAANFWASGNNSADLISVSGASSVITWERTTNLLVGICDPTQGNTGTLTVTLNRPAGSLASADPGITVVQLAPKIILSVNLNGSRGRSFQAAFNYSNAIVPLIMSISPSGATAQQSTNSLSFKIASAIGVSTNGVVLTLNGQPVTNLVFSGSATNWAISYPHLSPNTVYTAFISVTDANGTLSTATQSFDTFSAGNYSWEAEDFDYGGGRFIDNPQTNAFGQLGAITNVDVHQVKFGGVYLYRTNGMDTEANGDSVRPRYNGTGYTDYSLSYFGAGSWANYTRRYPAGSYYVYARLASGGGATTCTLSRVTGGWGTTSQTTTLLGTFSVPNTAWESYNYVPLQDSQGRLVSVQFNGSTNTLQLGRPTGASSDCNANFLMLVPLFTLSAASSQGNLALSFPTQSGFNYQAQYKTNLADASWQPLGNSLAGNDAVASLVDLPSDTTRFYRVQLQ